MKLLKYVQLCAA